MVPVGGERYKESVKEAEKSGNIMYSCENGTIRHVETIPGVGGGA
jgi:hypothetical protein